MANRLNQHLERKYTAQPSDRMSQHPPPGPATTSQHPHIHQYNEKPLDGGAEAPSYLCFIKHALILTALFCLSFTLPLCLIIHFHGSSDGTFPNSLSTFTLASSPHLQLLPYLSFPVFLLHIGFLILLSLKLQHIQAQTDLSKRIPTGYALFLRVPPPQLNEEQICYQIEAWFRRELKLNKLFPETFPQLSQPQPQISQVDSSLSEEGQGKGKRLHSRIVETVLLSYSYEEYIKISQEVKLIDSYMKEDKGQLKQGEIKALLHLYNKRKNLRELLPVNQYYLVIFKMTKYAKYFYDRIQGNPFAKFFCVESYSEFQIEKQPVDMVEGVLPNQIYWKNLHHSASSIVKKRLVFISIWVLLLSVGLALLFVLIYQGLQSVITSLLISVWTIITNKILTVAHQKQPYAYYSKQKKAIVGYIWLIDMMNLCFGPLAITYIISPALITQSNYFILEQLTTLIFFMVFSIADLLLNLLCRKPSQPAQINTTQNEGIQQHLANNITIFAMILFTCTFFPLVCLIGVVWFVVLLLFHNFSAKNKQMQYRGGKLLNYFLKFVRRAILSMLIGQLSVFGLAATQLGQLGIDWPTSAIIIISLLATLTIMLQFVELPIFSCFQRYRKSELKKELVDLSYSQVKDNFVMTYEQYNFALDNFKQLQHGFNARIKIYQQLSTMSKTLSLSLKQRLFNNPHPIINNQSRVEKNSQDVNDIYFQYERKVTMKKITPKVPIPPLFKKQEEVEHDPQCNNQMEMMNFYSIFSSDNQDARKMLKRHIKKELKGNQVHTFQ